jgi:hypothetical protein
MKIFPLTIYVLLKPFIQILPSLKKKLVGFSHYGHFSQQTETAFYSPFPSGFPDMNM